MRWLYPGIALVFKALIAIGVLALAFYSGIYLSRVESETQTTAVVVPTVECKLVERQMVYYVDRPITVAQSIERVGGLPVEPRHFRDLEELKQWLKAVEANSITVYFQLPDSTVDCDDYALDLQRKALADGYIISFQVISRSEYNWLFNRELPPGESLHAINLAITGNSAYYIEPQTGDIVFAAHLD